MVDYNDLVDSACTKNNFKAWGPFSCYCPLVVGWSTLCKEFEAKVCIPTQTCFWLSDIKQYLAPWVSIF